MQGVPNCSALHSTSLLCKCSILANYLTLFSRVMGLHSSKSRPPYFPFLYSMITYKEIRSGTDFFRNQLLKTSRENRSKSRRNSASSRVHRANLKSRRFAIAEPLQCQLDFTFCYLTFTASRFSWRMQW